MNALNDLISIINRLETPMPELETIKADKLMLWLNKNQVLSFLLRENLHQPQYAEKVTKVVQFITESHELSLKDLQEIWDAQAGQHEAIVKNVENMLEKLVGHLTSEHLDHLFVCFGKDFETANRRQRERLIELIRRLAVKERESFAMKALDFLWKLATNPILFNEVMQTALSAHKQILDSCREQKPLLEWLNRFSAILKEDSNDYDVVCACRQFYDVCSLFPQYSEAEVVSQQAINDDLINVCIGNLEHYMQRFNAPLLSPTSSPLDLTSSPSWFDPEENELLREYALAFFEQNILKIEPQRLTPAVMK
ncbi:unnamed protein product [Dibothriocephalus latus]|uniref:ubiquitinyl hydrolase 1 n=1 Tax=Dibothriocephalus latus TaxID=60516 RepID=A0A3P7P2V6_DIBLA|nr:unnamed protein product [Dibothriocephalus latus]